MEATKFVSGLIHQATFRRWLDGAAEIDGFADSMEDGWADTLGDSDGINVGTPVLVGLVLGWLDG